MKVSSRILLGLLVLLLAACFHEKEDEVPRIPPPDLSELSKLVELSSKPLVSLTDTETVASHTNLMLRRLLSLLDTTNREIDLLGSYVSQVPTAPYSGLSKVSSRALDFVPDSSTTCVGGDTLDYDPASLAELQNKEVILWDDIDGNREPNAGDEWIRFIKSCLDDQNNRRTIDGSVYYLGLKSYDDLKLQELNFTLRMDYQFVLDIGNYFVVSNLVINVIRDTDGYITLGFSPANPSVPATIGFGTQNLRYAFTVENLLIRFYADPDADPDTPLDLQTVEFNGNYAFINPETDATPGLEGRIEVVNSTFVFDYDSQALRKFNIEMKGDADATVEVSTASDYSQAEVMLGSEAPETIEFQTIFDMTTKPFNLINLD